MFNDFVNLYNTSRTFRFELIPQPNTAKHLAASKAVQTDKKRHEHFKTAKRVLDVVHRKFVDESLSVLELDTAELKQYIDAALLTNKTSAKEISQYLKPIYARFAHSFEATDQQWKERYNYKKSFINSSETQLSVAEKLRKEIAEKLNVTPAEILETLAEFDKFAAYFTGYLTNRANCYTTEGKATEIAHRTIAQNLFKFYKNLDKYCKYYPEDEVFIVNEKIFRLDNYGQFITQEGIDRYNGKIGELNSRINQLRQMSNKEEKRKLPLLEPLFKQILSESTKPALFETLQNAEEYEELMGRLQQRLPAWLQSLRNHYDNQVRNVVNPDQVFINRRAVNTLLYKTIENPGTVQSLLPESFNKRVRGDDEATKQSGFVSLAQFFSAVDEAQAATDTSILKDQNEKTTKPSEFAWNSFCNDLAAAIEAAKQSVNAFSELTDFSDSAQSVIKKALDDFNDVYRMYSYFELRFRHEPVTTLDEDEDFYKIFKEQGDEDSLFHPDRYKRFSHYYDLIRNWLTKKPYSLEKWKLNFDCSQLLDGWDINKEPEKHGVILKNKDDYYLVILNNQDNKALDRTKHPELFNGAQGDWLKMEYKLLPGANKMLPKCLLPKSDRTKYGATPEIIELYEKGEFKKGENFDITKLHKLIDFYKQALKRYEGWSMFDFSFRPTSEYQSIDQFYRDVEYSGYKLGFTPVNYDQLAKLEEKGSIYIFKISNKDLAHPHSSKNPNTHTLYFRALFNPNSNIKLNGRAEIFFRPKSMEKAIDKDRTTPQGADIIKHRRFTEDKIFFHVPITLNYKAPSPNNVSFNRHAIERIKHHKIDTVIGIDRGENHLLYAAVVNRNGKLVEEPISLNTINRTPYFDLLKQREEERRQDRQNWQAIRQIKDLKAGYIGHCVKQIIDLMIRHRAIVILENLNVGFKQGRSKIERSTYSQFEQALLNKLQYVVDKKRNPDELFGVERGVQLTPPDVSPKITGNHMGFVMYVDPSYTSAVDPVTGYRQHFRLDNRINASTFQTFIAEGFEQISLKDGHLVFTFNWHKLASARNKIKKDYATIRNESDINDKQWTITANVDRYIFKRNKNNRGSTTEKINPQEILLALFKQNNIDPTKDIKSQLINKKPTAEFVKQFVWCFNIINQLRNKAGEDDSIISPVYPNGFNSLRDTFNGYKWNGDANGAYNIARKGIILLNKLYDAKTPEEFKNKVDRKEYDDYITEG